MLMNYRMKAKVVFAICNLFLKIELNCDKENFVSFKYMQFSKEDVAYNHAQSI